MTHAIRWVVLGAVVALGTATPAAAQDVTLGYQFQRVGSGDGFNLPLGFHVDAGAPIGGSLSVLGQLDWSRRGESDAFPFTQTLLGVLGGVRWSSAANARAIPFVDAGVGVARFAVPDLDFSATDPMVQIGGGVAAPMNDRTDLVAQFDYRRIFTNVEGTNSIRFVLGVRFGM